MNGSAWAVWFVGLPGSGKSSVAGRVVHRLRENGLEVAYLQMDERRRVYFPRPEYTTGERNKAYELFAREAADMVQGGRNVVMDGTAPRVHMRRKARELIARFAEIHIRCSLPTAMQREADRPQGKVMADLYAKALERRETGR
ncbi:MAG: adenylyl-sulfate kinase, partial [Desulfonatronovibrionaceae bacterium]